MSEQRSVATQRSSKGHSALLSRAAAEGGAQ
jgi:hypothetical protein